MKKIKKNGLYNRDMRTKLNNLYVKIYNRNEHKYIASLELVGIIEKQIESISPENEYLLIKALDLKLELVNKTMSHGRNCYVCLNKLNISNNFSLKSSH